MAGSIKGITLKIEGDNKGLVKSLEEARQSVNLVWNSLKNVNKALKLDPTNVAALTQKQELLSKAIDATNKRLEEEKKIAEAAKEALKLGNISQQEYDLLQSQITKTNGDLKSLEDQAEETKQALAQIGQTDITPDTDGSAASSIQDVHDKVELLGRGLEVVQSVGDAAGAALQKGFDLAAAAAQKAYETARQVGELSYNLSRSVVEAYGDYEQLAGGVEKLFGSAARTVIRNSANAYRTAGLNANDYLETVTSFSASLISGLGGDVTRAAELSDMALQDMADNANTFGTAIENIQAVYQGLAKSQFTTLDNLRLGYGGTKTEMIRLINDSHILEEEISSLDDVTFDQMIEAIHAVQEQLHITGTTAQEAERTIQGSINMTKAAWQNLLIGLGQEGADVSALTNNLTNSILNVIDNVKPVLENMADRLPEIGPIILEKLRDTKVLQEATQIGAQIFATVCQAIIDAAPEMAQIIMDAVGPIIDQIFGEGASDKVREALNTIIERGPELASNVIEPLINLTSTLIEHLPQIVDAAIPLIEFASEHLPEIVGLLVGLQASGTIAGIASSIISVAGSISMITGAASGAGAAATGAAASLGSIGATAGSIAAVAGPVALLTAEVAALGYEAYLLGQEFQEAEELGISWQEALVGGVAQAIDDYTILGQVLDTDLAGAYYDLQHASEETTQTIDQQAQQAAIDIQLAIEQSGAAATQSVADDCEIIQSYLDNLEANGQIELHARVVTEYQTIMRSSAVTESQREMANRYSTQGRRQVNQQNWANSIHASAQAEYAAQQAAQGRAALQAIEETAQTAQRAITSSAGGGGGRSGGGGGGGSSKPQEEETPKSNALQEILQSISDKFDKLLEKFGIQTKPTEYQQNVNTMIDGLLKALETNYSDAAIEAAKAEIQKTMAAYGVQGDINAGTLEQLRTLVNSQPAQNTEAFNQVQSSVAAIQAATVDYTPHFNNISSVLGQLLALKQSETNTFNIYVGNELLDTYIQQAIVNQAVISGGVG